MNLLEGFLCAEENIHIAILFHPLCCRLRRIQVYPNEFRGLESVVKLFHEVAHGWDCRSTADLNNRYPCTLFLLLGQERRVGFSLLGSAGVVPAPVVEHQDVWALDFLALLTLRQVGTAHFIEIYLRLEIIG